MSRPPPINAPSNHRLRGGGSNGANPILTPSGASSSMTSEMGVGGMSRAERFEDEKRRIIESCFSKTDPSGQLSESYITHIRVQEDAQHPSSPPPPDSPEAGKKPRLVIVAVRSTGRVRMHKARENNNGSFSIGKSWNLEDLSAIESFANATPPLNQTDAHQRSWAGDVGFIVTITKPYYWEAGTAKEKEFFIASVVKIFRKYTKGQVPELRGFDERQAASMLGGAPPMQQQPQQPNQHSSLNSVQSIWSPTSPGDRSRPLQPPFAARTNSRDESRYRGSPGPPPSRDDDHVRNRSVQGHGQSPEPLASWAHAGAKLSASMDPLRKQSAELRPDSRPTTSAGPDGPRSPGPLTAQMRQTPGHHSRPTMPPPGAASQSFPTIHSPQAVRGRRPSDNASSDPYGQSFDGLRSPQKSGPNGRDEYAGRPRAPSPGTSYVPFSKHLQDPSPSVPPPLNISRSAKRQGDRRKMEMDDSDDQAGVNAALASLTGSQGPDHTLASPVGEDVSRSEKMEPPTRRRSTDTSRKPEPSKYAEPDLQSTSTPDPSTRQPEVAPLDTSRHETKPAIPTVEPIAPLDASTDAPHEGADEKKAGDEAEEAWRPGLGPMIRGIGVAERFKKAANAVNAFKPRPGGAAEKILRQKAARETNGDGKPDGISAVVPRPTSSKEQELAGTRDLSVKAPEQTATPEIDISPPQPTARAYDDMDGAPATHPPDGDRLGTPDPGHEVEAEDGEREREGPRQKQPARVKARRRSATQESYIAALGIDPAMLRGRCVDFEPMMDARGWKDAALSHKALAEIEAGLRRDLAKFEAGSWLLGPRQDAGALERVEQVEAALDKAIQECDEMDKLLTIYNVELSTLNADVSYIEAQSQGLQVQAANQRLLHTELSNLLETITLDESTLEQLRRADLGSYAGIEQTERSLDRMYHAMVTINPSIRPTTTSRAKSRSGLNEGGELNGMRALREKHELYQPEIEAFGRKLAQHLEHTFARAFQTAQSRVLPSSVGRINADAFMEARQGLWVYGPIILFAKEVHPPAWFAILELYPTHASAMYTEPLRQNIAGWKKAVRKPTGDESDLLFTTPEKDDLTGGGGALSSARKLTVKRSHTLAKTFRHGASGGGAAAEKPVRQEGRSTAALMAAEVFAAVLDETVPVVAQEQNFFVDLFHVTSVDEVDFVDAAAMTAPEARYGHGVGEKKPAEPDAAMARRVAGAMEALFTPLRRDLGALVDWAVATDPIQGVGVMACLARHAAALHAGNQEFALQTLDTLGTRLQALWSRFVDDQVRAIEETKVRVKKRKGVIGFMRVFPVFSAAVEHLLAALGGKTDDDPADDALREVRRRVDDAYERLHRAMFDSLKVIAKEEPATATTTVTTPAGAEPDAQHEKELLNYEVLIIENMHHYVEEVDDAAARASRVLAAWKARAARDRDDAMAAYVARVTRRPLHKLLVRPRPPFTQPRLTDTSPPPFTQPRLTDTSPGPPRRARCAARLARCRDTRPGRARGPRPLHAQSHAGAARAARRTRPTCRRHQAARARRQAFLARGLGGSPRRRRRRGRRGRRRGARGASRGGGVWTVRGGVRAGAGARGGGCADAVCGARTRGRQGEGGGGRDGLDGGCAQGAVGGGRPVSASLSSGRPLSAVSLARVAPALAGGSVRPRLMPVRPSK